MFVPQPEIYYGYPDVTGYVSHATLSITVYPPNQTRPIGFAPWPEPVKTPKSKKRKKK